MNNAASTAVLASFVVGILLLTASDFGTKILQVFAAMDEPAMLFEQEYKIVEGYYNNEELGFNVTFPDAMKGFLTEIDENSIVIQIHPESDSISCCPSIDITPAAILLDSAPLNTLSSPVPFTGDLYAAFQGYNMKVRIDRLGDTEVLVATAWSEREDIPDQGPIKRVGKFYFINNDERHISYGLWASEENYQKYLNEFEASAKSISLVNAKAVNLQSIFPQYYVQDAEVELKDGIVLHPEVITPSIVESIAVDEDSNTLKISINEPNGNSFLILNSRELLVGPHSITFDGKPIESVVLSNESGEYLITFYNQTGDHEVAIIGTAVIPEFDSIIEIMCVICYSFIEHQIQFSLY